LVVFEHVNINPSRFLTSYLYLENWNKIFTSESDSSYVPTVRRTAPGPNLSKTLGLFLSSCGALTLSTVTFRLLLLIFRLHAVRHVVGVVKLTCCIICKISFALFQSHMQSSVVVPCSLSILLVRGDHCVAD